MKKACTIFCGGARYHGNKKREDSGVANVEVPPAEGTPAHRSVVKWVGSVPTVSFRMERLFVQSRGVGGGPHFLSIGYFAFSAARRGCAMADGATGRARSGEGFCDRWLTVFLGQTLEADAS